MSLFLATVQFILLLRDYNFDLQNVCGISSIYSSSWIHASLFASITFTCMWSALSVMNSVIIVKLWKNRRYFANRQNITTAKLMLERERQINLLLVCTSVFFTILAIPDIILIVTTKLNKDTLNWCLKYGGKLYFVQDVLEAIGSGSDIFFFVMSGRGFRQMVSNVLGIRKYSSEGRNSPVHAQEMRVGLARTSSEWYVETPELMRLYLVCPLEKIHARALLQSLQDIW